MIETSNNKTQQAEALVKLWNNYFPDTPTQVGYWRMVLDEYSEQIVAAAIKRCVKKRAQLEGRITYPQMLAYVESMCFRIIAAEKQEATAR